MGPGTGKSLRWTVLGLAAAALVAAAMACGTEEAPAPAVEAPVTEGATTPAATQGQQEAATPAPTAAAGPHPLEHAARATAAAHEGLTEVQAAQLELTLWEAVTWPDASLGCQMEGYAYAAILTPGFRATYEHEGRTITIHLGEDGDSAFVPQGCLNDPAATGYPREG